MVKILDNIVFLAEVFGDKPDRDIPNLPVLGLAQCFDLKRDDPPKARSRRGHRWSSWQ